MEELQRIYPGARRALFRHYHLGGCSSCGYQPTETIAELCARNGGIDPAEMIRNVVEGHEADLKIQITPRELSDALANGLARVLDIRTAEEYQAARIEGAHLFNQPLMQEILSNWPKETLLVIVDHTGDRSIDAAAYFLGHGFANTRCLRGGIDAWSEEIDPSVPRYTVES